MLTIPEVAETCKLSIPSIRRAIWDGELRACKLRGQIRIKPADVAEWQASQEIAAPEVAPKRAQSIIRAPRPHKRRSRTEPPAGSFRALVPDAGADTRSGQRECREGSARQGNVWRVRYRDEDGNAHSHVVGRKADAVAYDEELSAPSGSGTSSRSRTRTRARRSRSSPRPGGTAT